MPDPLLHYSLGMLLARAQGLTSTQSLLVGVAGTLPDLDVFTGNHRGSTHSLIVSALLLALTLHNKLLSTE